MAPPLLERVLVVEDDPDIQLVVTLALTELGGLETRVCASATEALLAAPDFAPDLLLLDVMMPGTDGITALQALRRIPATSATPVVFMTARVQPREIAGYRALGCLGVIPKPFDVELLAARLQQLWSTR